MEFVVNKPINEIQEIFSVRALNQSYIDYLADDFQRNGYQNAYPVSITADGILWDGNHRLAAIRKLGWSEIPAIIETPDNIRVAAHERNRVAVNALPETFIDHAEEIWQMLESGKTQQEVADELGWKRTQIANYQALSNICKGAWEIVTTNSKNVTFDNDMLVTRNVTGVTFTENLLRDITSLTADQQIELVSKLARNGNYTKADFKKDACKYKLQNKIAEYIRKKLKDLDHDSIEKCIEESKDSQYISEWKEYEKVDKECDGYLLVKIGPKITQLINAYIDEWNKKHSYKLIHADILDGFKKIEDNSLDFIITDPPYSQKYLPLYESLSIGALKSLKEGGSLIIMVGQSYLPEIFNIIGKYLTYHWTLAYCTPGGQAVQLFQKKVNTFWKPLLWFVKGEYKGNWIGDVAKSNVNDNDKNFHEWGQSESGMKDIIVRFTNSGDLICDPFLGGGTTAVVALSMNRKFIGIDKDEKCINISKERIKKVLNA